MKKILTLIFAINLVFFAACKKDTLPAQIKGTWELRTSYGGMIADAPPTFKPGNGRIIKFTDKGYEFYAADGTMYQSGNYELVKDSRVVNKSRVEYRIVYDGDTKMAVWISVSGNRLTMFHGEVALDGVEQGYERI